MAASERLREQASGKESEQERELAAVKEGTVKLDQASTQALSHLPNDCPTSAVSSILEQDGAVRAFVQELGLGIDTYEVSATGRVEDGVIAGEIWPSDPGQLGIINQKPQSEALSALFKLLAAEQLRAICEAPSTAIKAILLEAASPRYKDTPLSFNILNAALNDSVVRNKGINNALDHIIKPKIFAKYILAEDEAELAAIVAEVFNETPRGRRAIEISRTILSNPGIKAQKNAQNDGAHPCPPRAEVIKVLDKFATEMGPAATLLSLFPDSEFAPAE